MKKMLFLLCLMTLSFTVFAADDCISIGDSDPIQNLESPIIIWDDDYQGCQYYEWILEFPLTWEYVEFDYVIDLNLTGAIDALMIYAEDTLGAETEILGYSYYPISGRITIPLYTSHVRVVFVSDYGSGGLSKGFKLSYRQGTPDYIFSTNVGIGISPQERLHINGPIRGNGRHGELTIKGDNGYVTIGASDSQTMLLHTNKSKYVFDKKICNQSGIYGSCGKSSLYLQTNDLYRMTILGENGNVGIGTTNPNYKLDVAGTIRANEIIVNTTGADFVFADDYQLRPLSEVKTFIQENKHLPEILSAQEMQENGVGINELQTQLLQKIEELTLYILQQEERIRVLEAKIGK